MLTYVNGEFVDDDEATIPVRDRGFLLGDAVFDAWRTYNGVASPRFVDKHLKRFERSMNYVEMPGEELVAEFAEAAAELVERNRDEIAAVGDVYVFSTVSRGQPMRALEGFDPGVPTRVIFCLPIPFDVFGQLYETGVSLVPSMLVRSPFGGSDPRVKANSRGPYTRAERKQARSGPGTWVALFDDEGNIAEATAAAVCVVMDQTVLVPPIHTRLPSVTLEVFCELAEEAGFGVREQKLTMYEFLNAEEAYVLATGPEFIPIANVDGLPVKRDDVVGSAVREAMADLVGCDFVKQAREFPVAV
jgi:branched-chain amino acid aminotransferase